eukprot:TRINITY_DN7285_c0_g1_i1.p1 TRINITY_DN7285_c0_g1~~TRINITY_DN7285_c0_g1_i1.p1  ORF type:complete len:778 (+),score=138.51 TRINITY_DN7285_c0_g1_i1:215-2548(+)
MIQQRVPVLVHVLVVVVVCLFCQHTLLPPSSPGGVYARSLSRPHSSDHPSWSGVSTSNRITTDGDTTPTPTSPVLDVFVSTNGSDANSGLSRHSPVATPQRAMSIVRAFPRPLNTSVVVWYEPGTYFLNETLLFEYEDGTTGSDPDITITHFGMNNDTDSVIFSGGAVVSGWSPHPTEGAVYTTILPAAAPISELRQMWSLSFTANSSDLKYHGMASHTIPTPDTSPAAPTDASMLRRFIQETDVDTYQTLFASSIRLQEQPNWDVDADNYTLSDAELLIWQIWSTSTVSVSHYNASNLTVSFSPAFSNYGPASSGSRFTWRNVKNVTLLEPGQFFLDRNNGSITYRALEGEDPTSDDDALVVPVLNEILVVQDSLGRVVSNIAFEGISIMHTVNGLGACLAASCDGQSASDNAYAAMHIYNASNIRFNGGQVLHTGSYGWWADAGTSNCTLSASVFSDLGAGGVRVGVAQGGVNPVSSSVVRDVLVENNEVGYGGFVSLAGAGVLVQEAACSSILHNIIHDFRYTGVSQGWTWSYEPTSVENNTISFNRIYNIGMAVLSDMGCIYTLGDSKGGQVINNVCSNVQAYGYGGWGLYTDQASKGIRFQDNIVFNTKSAGVHQHYGLDIAFVNNIIAFPEICIGANCDMAAVRSSNNGAVYGTGIPSEFTFTNNIVVLNQNISTLFFSTWVDAFANTTFDSNLYWTYAPTNPMSLQFPPTQMPTTFEGWQATGQDLNSLIADPLFNATLLSSFVFEVTPSSPALKLGFTPIDISTVGPMV